ncbi:astacin [Ancylostoma ceylanicum]|uniref:Metalloendopeptidase n=1 Tax=Ancylostoma ceylanicum TaxID=53326 RepID=A0A0D6M340_9BILA|nr:astacin [Ancylostoma ceylanicum]
MKLLPLVLVCAALHGAVIDGKPKVIDYQNQEGGDILDLREIMYTDRLAPNISEDELYNGYNALHPKSPNKWTTYPDNEGNFIIPYEIIGVFGEEHKEMIYDAMKELSRNTCIRFKQRTNEKEYLQIRNEKSKGCVATIGRQLTGMNILNLEDGEFLTCMAPHIVIHELIHVVGLWHEQMREDRDKYIKIHYENVKQGCSL